jgi:RHS repeat-associated protein
MNLFKKYRWLPILMTLVIVAGFAQEHLINNYQGSVIAVLGEDGSINYQKYLDPWGNLEMEIGNPSSNINFQYTDKELDANTNLYYFQARYYDPFTNHFRSRDRVHLEDNLKNYFGINPYVFTNNNPVRNRDADGNKNSNMAEFTRKNLMPPNITQYGVEYAGGNQDNGAKLNLSDRTMLVCNEVQYFSAKGSGEYKDFPYSGMEQANWFAKQGELFPINSSSDLDNIPNLGEGDVIFMFDKQGEFKHSLQINHYNSNTKEFSVMGAHSTKSGTNIKSDTYFIEDIKKWDPDWDIMQIGSFGSYLGSNSTGGKP